MLRGTSSNCNATFKAMAADQELFQEAQSQWNLGQLYGDLAIAKQAVAPHKQPDLTKTE